MNIILQNLKQTIMFTYLYYRIFSIYKYKWNDSTPGIYATCFVSILQFFNFSCLLFLFFFIAKTHLNINKIYGALLVVCIIGFNHYRFHIHSNFGLLEEKWKKETKQKKTRNGILIIIYIVLSVSLFLLLANYLGKINRKI